MFYVATLISAPDRAAVTDALARAAARYLPHGRPVDWLSPGMAVDIAFLVEDAEPGEVPALLKDMAGDLRDIIGGNTVDVVIQPQDNRRKKLLVADMDSTMIGQECIDELADYAGVKSQVAEITERAMRGDIAFAPALRERVALLKGLPAAIIDTVLAERIRLDAGRPDAGRHHARQWRLHLRGVRRIYRFYRKARRGNGVRRAARQYAVDGC